MHRDSHPIEQRLGLAVQNAGFGVWDFDILQQTVHYSPQWKALLGYDDTDAPDSVELWRSRVHPDDLPAMLTALQDHFESRSPAYEMEFRLRAADGRYLWVLSRGRVVDRDAQGEPLRAIGTLTDLTRWREAQRLRAERDRHDAASQARGEFLRRMNHELHTPLNAILGFAQLLGPRIGGADVDTQRRYLGHIEQAGWQLLELIDELLALPSGGNELTLSPEDQRED
jgi:PAS domain S-box-containing protein